MKKIFFAMALAAAFLLPACNQQEVDERLSSLEDRVTRLEEQVKTLNSQVSLVNELLSGKYFISRVVDLSDGSGYMITLVDKDGKSVDKTILNGKDGEDGQDGHSPEISVKKDTDGNWYWTLDGSWLLVGGEKVRANGIDGQQGASGLTPEFKIGDDGNWYVRLGGGAWQNVGPAVKEISGPIVSVDNTKDDVVVFTLTGGVTIEVPRAASAIKLQLILDENAFAEITEGGTASTEYTVKAPSGITYTLDSFEPEGWVVTITDPVGGKGTITVVLPEETESGKIMFVLNGSDGSSYTKVVRVGVIDKVVVNTDSGAGTLDLPAGATDVTTSADWVTVQSGKLLISANTGYDARTAVVTYKDANGVTHVITIVQAQVDAIVLTEPSVEADPEGETVLYYIRANVQVDVQADVDWISVSPVTKGLVEIPYSFDVLANNSGEARTGHVTFTSGELSQTVEVNQEASTAAPTVSEEYLLVTDASTLAAGDELLVVNLDGEYAMGPQSNNYRSVVGVTVQADCVVEFPENAAVITLEGTPLSWNLKVSDGYLASGTSNSNYLRTVTTLSDNACWTISVSDGVATVVAKSGNKNHLRYNENNGSPRFSCYSSTSSMPAVALYRRTETQVDPVTAFEEIGGYLGRKKYVYTPGTDQYVRSYQESALTFVLLNPESLEQMVITGYSTSMQKGDQVTMHVEWQGYSAALSESYPMTVLKEQGRLVWIGDTEGNGFIIKK